MQDDLDMTNGEAKTGSEGFYKLELVHILQKVTVTLTECLGRSLVPPCTTCMAVPCLFGTSGAQRALVGGTAQPKRKALHCGATTSSWFVVDMTVTSVTEILWSSGALQTSGFR